MDQPLVGEPDQPRGWDPRARPGWERVWDPVQLKSRDQPLKKMWDPQRKGRDQPQEKMWDPQRKGRDQPQEKRVWDPAQPESRDQPQDTMRKCPPLAQGMVKLGMVKLGIVKLDRGEDRERAHHSVKGSHRAGLEKIHSDSIEGVNMCSVIIVEECISRNRTGAISFNGMTEFELDAVDQGLSSLVAIAFGTGGVQMIRGSTEITQAVAIGILGKGTTAIAGWLLRRSSRRGLGIDKGVNDDVAFRTRGTSERINKRVYSKAWDARCRRKGLQTARGNTTKHCAIVLSESHLNDSLLDATGTIVMGQGIVRRKAGDSGLNGTANSSEGTLGETIGVCVQKITIIEDTTTELLEEEIGVPKAIIAIKSHVDVLARDSSGRCSAIHGQEGMPYQEPELVVHVVPTKSSGTSGIQDNRVLGLGWDNVVFTESCGKELATSDEEVVAGSRTQGAPAGPIGIIARQGVGWRDVEPHTSAVGVDFNQEENH